MPGKPHRPTRDLLSFFKPVSSPSTRSSASPAPSQESRGSNATREQSNDRRDDEGQGSVRSNGSRSKRPTRPGVVAVPGTEAAALKWLATAPARLDAASNSARLSPPRPVQIRSKSSVAPPTLSSDCLEPPSSDASQATVRAPAVDLAPSSPTPRREGSTSPATPSSRPPLRTPEAPPAPMTSPSMPESTEEKAQPDRKAGLELSSETSALTRSLQDATGDVDVTMSDMVAGEEEQESVLPSRASRKRASTPSTSEREAKPTPSPASVRKKVVVTPHKAFETRASSRVLRSASKEPAEARHRSLSRSLSPVQTRSSPRLRASREPSEPPHLAPITTPPRVSVIAASSSAPRNSQSRRTDAFPSTSRGPSPAPSAAMPSSALLETPRRATRYDQDPSGSPLSDLAPTPIVKRTEHRSMSAKPTTTTTTTKPEGWRPHSFELVVEIPEAKWKRMQKAGEVRKPKQSRTSEFTDESRSSGDDDDDDDDDDEDHEESAGEAMDEDESRDGSERGHASPSRSAAKGRRTVKRERDKIESSSESGGASDDEDVFAALARARARVAAGATLATAATVSTTSPDVPSTSTSTAPTTVSSNVTEPVRSSTRARRSNPRYSPTATFGARVRTTTATPTTDVKGKGKAKDDGTRSFERLMREMQSQQRRGRGTDWLEARKLEINGSDDDLDDASDDSDEELPSLSMTDSKRLDTLASGIAGNVSEEDLLSPDKRANKRRAREVADILGDEVKKKAGLAGESNEDREARTMWRDVAETTVDALEVEAFRGEGWLGRMTQLLRDGLARPQAFPSAIKICSSLDLLDLGVASRDDQKIVCRRLLSIISHPSTATLFAEKCHHLLAYLAQQIYRSSTTSDEHILDLGDWTSALAKLGAKVSDDTSNEEAASAPTPTPKEDECMDVDASIFRAAPARATVALTGSTRASALHRWAKALQALSSPSSRVVSSRGVPALVETCVRLSLDPSSSTSRGTLERTLASLLESVAPKDDATHVAVLRRLTALYRPSNARIQVEALRALPHRTKTEKRLRRWLAWSFMSADEEYDTVQAQENPFSSEILPRLHALLKRPPPSSAFNPPRNTLDTSSDIKLFDQATLLTIALTDLDDSLHVNDNKVENRATLQKIRFAISKIDARLRASAREGMQVERLQAKNLLTALNNSLDYQLRRAKGQTGAIPLDEAAGPLPKKLKRTASKVEAESP
ncbi:hypothetical protein JCM10212_000510 [Sporobolomyces blumeae]